jgi:hypothetical protein
VLHRISLKPYITFFPESLGCAINNKIAGSSTEPCAAMFVLMFSGDEHAMSIVQRTRANMKSKLKNVTPTSSNQIFVQISQ